MKPGPPFEIELRLDTKQAQADLEAFSGQLRELNIASATQIDALAAEIKLISLGWAATGVICALVWVLS